MCCDCGSAISLLTSVVGTIYLIYAFAFQKRIRPVMFMLINVILTQYHDAYLWYKQKRGELTPGVCPCDEKFNHVFLMIAVGTMFISLYYELTKTSLKYVSQLSMCYRKYFRYFALGYGILTTVIYSIFGHCEQIQGCMLWGPRWATLLHAVGFIIFDFAFAYSTRMLYRSLWIYGTLIFSLIARSYSGTLWASFGLGLVGIDFVAELMKLV